MSRNRSHLTAQLEAFKSSFLQRLPASERQVLLDKLHANEGRAETGPVMAEGDQAPGFALPNQDGRVMRLADWLAVGPVVLLFVRGGWCPLCALTLRAYQDWLPMIHQEGAELLAITPQPRAVCSQIAERDLLAFPTLSDQGNQVADQYGAGYELDPALRPMHLRLGNDIPRINGTGNWRIPLPATFVIGQDGRVWRSHVPTLMTQRLEPSDAVAALRAMAVARQAADA